MLTYNYKDYIVENNFVLKNLESRPDEFRKWSRVDFCYRKYFDLGGITMVE